MGPLVFVPEGETDFRWWRALQRAAESVASGGAVSDLTPLTLVPTQSSAIAATFADVSRLRPDAVPIIDGDDPGNSYIDELEKLPELKPRVIVQMGQGAAVEYLAAWILEPSLSAPKSVVTSLLPNAA